MARRPLKTWSAFPSYATEVTPEARVVAELLPKKTSMLRRGAGKLGSIAKRQGVGGLIGTGFLGLGAYGTARTLYDAYEEEGVKGAVKELPMQAALWGSYPLMSFATKKLATKAPGLLLKAAASQGAKKVALQGVGKLLGLGATAANPFIGLALMAAPAIGQVAWDAYQEHGKTPEDKEQEQLAQLTPSQRRVYEYKLKQYQRRKALAQQAQGSYDYEDYSDTGEE